MVRLSLLLAIHLPLSASLLRADWYPWRGSSRTGVIDSSTPIANSLPAGDLTPSWESETIPSDHDGGHSSPVVSGGRAYLSVVWHSRVPSDIRIIDDEVVSNLGHRGTQQLGPELTKK